ncbi:imidazole glycerol phosphate synthase subunit HisH [Arenicella xantha]|uniref:Imidazole glycerol phosphate synthase subunit HisH n=1 Tax=Arenicella xantha TaxID=644221 RepID=A0A395JGX0_9GAMM|nr:imidazole glycerol phosphate synthase subunit HisH [Arenicella xantha]RBP48685.1 glutamine amidotransferase [Arenicella xantha]
MRIAVIDLGIGNLRSVRQALHAVAPNAQIDITDQASIIDDADRIVLPGQGAIGTWFKSLHEKSLELAVKKALTEKPVLGVCVGMQAMFSHSDEHGGQAGFDLFEGQVRHFSNFHDDSKQKLKIPQMGWNQVQQTQPHALWHGIDDQSHFYFVHSYCANLAQNANQEVVQGEADYGHHFIAAVGRDNIFAVQFHPEKSHNDGLRLLKNFTLWNPTHREH